MRVFRDQERLSSGRLPEPGAGFLVILATGYALEWAVADGTGRRVLR